MALLVLVVVVVLVLVLAFCELKRRRRRLVLSPDQDLSVRPAYPVRVGLSVIALRRRMPLLVCVLLLVFCVAAVGTTCAVCVSAHPGQTLEHTLSAFPTAAPPPAAGWGFVLVLAVAPLLVGRRRVGAFGRASPALLQRFLF